MQWQNCHICTGPGLDGVTSYSDEFYILTETMLITHQCFQYEHTSRRENYLTRVRIIKKSIIHKNTYEGMKQLKYRHQASDLLKSADVFFLSNVELQ